MNISKITHLIIIFFGGLLAIASAINQEYILTMGGFGLMIYALGNYWGEERIETLKRKLKWERMNG